MQSFSMKTESFYRLAGKALKGIKQLGAALGLTHVNLAAYEPVYLEAKARAQAFGEARRAKSAAYATLRARRAEADEFLLDVRNYLTAFLSDTWSPAWIPLGFPNPSLKLPDTDAGRCQVLEKFQIYFVANPAHENAAKQFTAARAGTLCTALDGALTDIDACKESTRTRRDARDTAEAALDGKLAALQSELEVLLPPNDPRWLRFFGRIPGDPRVPEAVKDVTATAQPGVIALDWPDTVRAARYQVLKQVVGTDADFVLADTVEDSEAELSLTGVPAGAAVKLQVVPLNEIGPGAPSAVLELRAA